MWRRLSMGRRAGEPLDWKDLQAFQDLTGETIDRAHVDAIMVLDRCHLAQTQKRK